MPGPTHQPPIGSSQPQQASIIPAAQYVRMSTEHQKYSTENQGDSIREYAQRRGYQIVRTYADDGKSGLKIQGRDSLQRLIADVQKGRADFKTILVYDISRWGRFQDSDESAYYEYLCKRAGIGVEYCAEQFENDGSPTATIIKSVKRAMAGEYSRELSTKVFKGQCRLIELGYRQGGSPGYGLRRMLLNERGEEKGLLKRGEKKSLQTDRVVLVPGPEEERIVVRRIYQLFTVQGLKESQIAQQLNTEGTINTECDRPWSAGMVHQVLANEKYIGNNIYNRVSFKLKKKRVRNGPDKWVRRDGAFPPIVEPSLFYIARGIIQERGRRFSDEEMLTKLKGLLDAHGKLSAELIDNANAMPSSSSYATRFGNLIKAYRLAGFVPPRDYEYLEINRRLRDLKAPLLADVIDKLAGLGARISTDAEHGQLTINGEYSADIVMARCRQTPGGVSRWFIELDRQSMADITIVVRADVGNQAVTDFFLMPRIDMTRPSLRLREDNHAGVETYRRDTLDSFLGMAARASIEVAA